MWVGGRGHTLVAAINEATAEGKYFLTDATPEPPARVLSVTVRRRAVEHSFRLGEHGAGRPDRSPRWSWAGR